MKKFELTEETKIVYGHTLYRIRAVRSFTLISGEEIANGELGGFVEKENNLSHDDNAWVYGNAQVYGNAEVYGDAEVYGNARVYDNAWVYGNAQVYGNAEVSGDAEVYGDAEVSGDAEVRGNAQVYGNAEVYGDAWVYGDAQVYGNAEVSGDAEVYKCEHLLVIGPIGSRNACTTFFRDKDKEITVSCGCFLGKLDKFLEAVSKTHGDSKNAVVYKAAVEVAKLHIDLTEENEND